MHRGYSAILAVIGLVGTSMMTASTSQAAPADTAASGKPIALVKPAKHVSARVKKVARSAHVVARRTKVSAARRHGHTIAAIERDDAPADKVAGSAALPPDVANAHAELTAGDVPSHDTSTLTDADRNAAAETSDNGVQIAAADQLNDIDRAMDNDAVPPPAAPAPQTTPTQAAPAPMMSTYQNHGNPWDVASLLGKVFIVFGTGLTLASAARMLLA